MELEEQYERKLRKVEESEKQYKMLLPVKTKSGFHTQREEIKDEEADDRSVEVAVKTDHTAHRGDGDENSMANVLVSFGKLIGERTNALYQYRLRIGTMSASFLEDPQNRVCIA